MADASAASFKKAVLHAGKGEKPSLQKNTKVLFHVRTLKLEADGSLDEDNIQEKVIDDTRVLGTGPFELLIGREFKLGIWEEMVRTMAVGEVARFTCAFHSVMEYPQVSKALRSLAKRKAGQKSDHDHHHHHCGFSAMQLTGYGDLDRIMQDRSPLAFEFELVRVEQPGAYKQASWAMSEHEKASAVPTLKEEGNALYRARDYQAAADKYFEALSHLEGMSIKEKPQSDVWNSIEERKVPLLLNYAQCKLLVKDYAEVITHTTTVLEFDASNVKAFYRRAKAHAACWNVEEAKMDFAEVVRLDPSLSRAVEKEVSALNERVKEKDKEERERLRGKLF